MFDALSDYKVTGSRRIQNATSTLVGSMTTRPDIWSRLSKKWVKQIAVTAAAVTWSLSTAVSAKELMPGPEPDPKPIVQVYCLTTGTEPGEIEADDESDVQIQDAEIVEDQPTG